MDANLPPANLATAQKLGLTAAEFDKIKKKLGRTPNFTELSIYSAMWSEHCSYKNSIHWLKKLPKTSPRILVAVGEENAGLVDIGDGWACVFKIESHNHPSAIEPYQGAATGVGGINRDIFCMGARPVAQLNSLRFGNPSLPKTQWLVKGVVQGIGHYGNAFGIPTVGGELYFDDTYNGNPLVNAFSIGLVKTQKTAKAIAYGAGNSVFIVGAATGKDGIHGATFASKEIHKDSAQDLPAVQVGDPFQEKLLLEATLEIIDTGHVIGLQDMGAAGIICATSEMSAKGKHGMDIWLDKVPTRQQNMQPWELLLSESQERMLVVIQKGKENTIQTIFDKWGLRYAKIGIVTTGNQLNFYMYNALVAAVPATSLVLGGGAPVYKRSYQTPIDEKALQKFDTADIPLPKNYPAVAKYLLAHPNIASRAWVAEQYDSMVGTDNTNTNAPADAAVIRIKGTDKAMAITVDCNSRYVHAHPEQGTAIAVAEAARNIVCTGGEPVAITNCLNFGNPYVPAVYGQFVGAIKGMKKACEKFNTPVTGGNVSFYNQSSATGPVFPTPVIGMLGMLENVQQKMTLGFKTPGDLIYLIGTPQNCIASSEYLYSYCQIKTSPAPMFDLEEEWQLHQTIQQLIQARYIQSAHDVADGGLFITLSEAAFPHQLGFCITTDTRYRKDAYLFGESQGRVVVSVKPAEKNHFEKMLNTQPTAYKQLGKVHGDKFIVDNVQYCTCQAAKEIYETALPKIFKQQS